MRPSERMKGGLLALGALGLIGALVAVLGLVPLRASAAHWALTAWFLHGTMARSVGLWSGTAPQAPTFEDEGALLRGAGHFETGCAPCHGSPGKPPSPVYLAMSPPPPDLSEVAPEWDDAELFYLVKHGVKMTGMPAWPAQDRDDEVWGMVSFLRLLPGLDGPGYTALVSDPAATPPIETPCARCHGLGGLGREGAFPRLGGQRPEYLLASLRAFAWGTRPSGIMGPIARDLADAQLGRLATHYGRLPASTRPLPPLPDADLEAGETIARRGIPPRRIPACLPCHGPGPGPRNPLYPDLRAQPPAYLLQQLRLFEAGIRGGSDLGHLMHTVSWQMTDAQRRDVASWYGAQTQRSPPLSAPGAGP